MIELDLRRHCIETEIKRLHNRWVDLLLKPGADLIEAENTLQVLRDALDRLDFPRLRAAFPKLAGNQPGEIKLLEDPGGRLKLMINHESIDLAPYCKSEAPPMG